MLWRILKIMISGLFTLNRIGLRMTNSTLDFRIWKLRTLSDEKCHVVSIASVEVASDLFTVLPLKRYIFKLTKSELRDNQGVRYNIQANKHFYQPLLCRDNFTKQQFSMRGYTYMQRGFIPKSGAQKIKTCLQKKSWRMLWRRRWSVILVYGGKKAFYNKSDSFDDNARLDIKANNSWASRFNEFSSTSKFLILYKFFQNKPGSIQVAPQAITVLD